MKAYQIQSDWGLLNLNMVDRPSPKPDPHEVLVRIKAVSLNFRDHLVVAGQYNPRYPLPLTPCSDLAGEVIATGSGVQDWQEGDRVMANSVINWMDGQNDRSTLKNALGGPLQGSLQETICLPAEALLKLPDHLSFIEGATLPCAAVTAWSAMFTHGKLVAGQTVLLLGTGGVSVFALQLARLAGLRTIITSSSDEKLKRARDLGADHTINYHSQPDWEKEVLNYTNGMGVDHVIEVGGVGTLNKSLKSVRPGGQISLIGVLAGAAPDLNLLPVLMQNICIQGIFVGHKASFQVLNRAIEQHQMHPVIDRVFSFADAKEALQQLPQGRHFGKLVVQMEE